MKDIMHILEAKDKSKDDQERNINYLDLVKNAKGQTRLLTFAVTKILNLKIRKFS